MRLWWQQEMAKLRTISGATAVEHAVLLVLLGILLPLLIALALGFAEAASPTGLSL